MRNKNRYTIISGSQTREPAGPLPYIGSPPSSTHSLPAAADFYYSELNYHSASKVESLPKQDINFALIKLLAEKFILALKAHQTKILILDSDCIYTISPKNDRAEFEMKNTEKNLISEIAKNCKKEGIAFGVIEQTLILPAKFEDFDSKRLDIIYKKSLQKAEDLKESLKIERGFGEIFHHPKCFIGDAIYFYEPPRPNYIAEEERQKSNASYIAQAIKTIYDKAKIEQGKVFLYGKNNSYLAQEVQEQGIPFLNSELNLVNENSYFANYIQFGKLSTIIDNSQKQLSSSPKAVGSLRIGENKGKSL